MTGSSDTGKRDFRGIDERLAEWQRASLWRQRRLEKLAEVRHPDYHTRNLVARPGVIAHVDSFLGTINGDPEQCHRSPDAIEADGFRFRLEEPSHPVLEILRERFGVDQTAGRGSDFERASRLREWVKSRWPHQLPFANPAYNGLTILDRAERGETFICMHYSVTLIQCCLAAGIQARLLNLHRGIAEDYQIGHESTTTPPVDEHVTVEVWCRELDQWVMLDPDFDCHYERNGKPLSGWQIHEAFIAGELDALAVRRGPGATAYESLGPTWYELLLPAYYAHLSVFLRNDFLSDPDGPAPVFHPVDPETPPILWYRGEDMRLRPDLLGPLVVATPYTPRTPLLGDGNLESGWASSDNPVEHSVEITFAKPATVDLVALHWPEWRSRARTSRTYTVDAFVDGLWRRIVEVVDNPERPWTIHEFAPREVQGVRIVQPPRGGFPEHVNRLWLTQIECIEAAT